LLALTKAGFASKSIHTADKHGLEANETTVKGDLLRIGKPHIMERTVGEWGKTKAGKAGKAKVAVSVHVDGKKVIDWEGAANRMTWGRDEGQPIVKVGKSRCLWLQAWDTSAITKLELKPIGAGGVVWNPTLEKTNLPSGGFDEDRPSSGVERDSDAQELRS